MKKLIVMVLSSLFCFYLMACPAIAEEMSNCELNERIKILEEKISKKSGQEWTNRITISGALEAEAGFTSTDYNDPDAEDEDTSDIVLSTVEIGIDVEIHKHVSGHVLFLYEEDENDSNIAVDEGFISIDGKDVVPLYLNAGQIYLPFGQFESHMVTDPLTLELGETSQSAIQVGYANDIVDASVAIFNGDVDESDSNNVIDSYAVGVQFSLPEDTITNVGLSAGISYISNIADTDGFEGFLEDNEHVEDHVAGMGAFFRLSFIGKVYIEAEYIGALDEFKDGDLIDEVDDDCRPGALNLELAVAPMENLEFAVRYGKTEDIKGGIEDEVLPETQYGVAVAYSLFDSTTLALEYLKSDYENNDEESIITAQLAIEF